MKLLTTADAAEKLGVSQRRIVALISGGRLPAQRLGRDYLIDETNLKLVANRKPGRPAKANGRSSPIKQGSKTRKR